MSQRVVEAILGRPISDLEFRLRFVTEPVDTSNAAELGLTAREATDLMQVSARALEHVTAQLDPRIARAVAIPSPRPKSANTVRDQQAGRHVAAASLGAPSLG